MTSFMRQINVISRCATMFRANKYKEKGLGIGAGHSSYIMILCRRPGISQDALAKRICVNKSNVTRHLAQLEKNGYVERKQSGTDKRVILVYPTEKAYAIVEEVCGISNEWKQYLMEDFSADEIEMLTDMLHRMAKKAADYAARELDGEDLTEL